MNENQTINIWDCFPITAKDDFDIKDGLMRGRMKDGYKQGDPKHFRNATSIKDYVHSVLLLFSYDDLNNKQKVEDFEDLYC